MRRRLLTPHPGLSTGIGYYLSGMEEDVFFSYNDKDLERIISFERNGETTEYNLRWILHHLIDHESQHKGQIFMLKRLMAI